jgi:hypothetical protein
MLRCKAPSAPQCEHCQRSARLGACRRPIPGGGDEAGAAGGAATTRTPRVGKATRPESGQQTSIGMLDLTPTSVAPVALSFESASPPPLTA